jgi:hypothetical protein
MNLPDTPAVMPPVECQGLLSPVSANNIFAGNLVKTKSLIGCVGLPLIQSAKIINDPDEMKLIL